MFLEMCVWVVFAWLGGWESVAEMQAWEVVCIVW